MTLEASAEVARFKRTLEDLSDEAEMAEGKLARAKIDQLYLKRSIDPDDAIRIEMILKERGFTIDEDLEIVDVEEVDERTSAVGFATAFDHLMSSARRVKLLKPDEEAAYGEAVQRAAAMLEKPEDERTDIERRTIVAGRRAFDRLVHHNIRLVTSFVNHPSYRYRHDLDDMVQMGLLGLMKAAEKFDPANGCRFSTYAMWWIRQSVYRGIANDGQTIRLPVHMIALVSKFRRTRRTIDLNGHLSAKAISHIADTLGWSTEFTARVAQIAEMRTVSFEAPIGPEGETKLGDVIQDDLPGPEETVVANDTAQRVRMLIEELPDERQKDIIRRRFGLDGPEETLEIVGQHYGVTRERIRQIESKVLRRLRRWIMNGKLESIRKAKS